MKTTLTHTVKTLALGLALAAFALPAAQAGSGTRAHTFVSSAGLDSNSTNGNACSRSAPCATFQGALSVTNPGGIVSVIDAGDYGPMTIGQNVTIDGTGSNAAVTLTTGTAVTISPGSNATVTLRHLTLTGPGGTNNSTHGIAVSDGSLLVEDCKLSGFSIGLSVNSGSVVVQNSTITNCNHGIDGNAGLLSVRDSTLQGGTYGVSQSGGLADLSRCTVAQNSGEGLLVTGFGSSPALTATGCTLSGNGGAVLVSGAPGPTPSGSPIVNLNDNDVWNNGTGFSTSYGGIIATAGNNRKAGNTTSGAPTPGATVTVQ